MSQDLNSVFIIGRLTRDAELKFTASGQPLCNFAIAVNRRVKKGEEWAEEASFFDVTLWGKSGEALNQYLLKGKQVALTGELKQDRWTDNEGAARSKVVISAQNIQLLGGGAQSSGGSQGVAKEEIPW